MFFINALLFGAVVAIAPFHPTISPPYTFHDTIIRLRFDLTRETVYGHETAVIRMTRDVRSIPFDSSGIQYDRITVNGKTARYHADDATQRVSVDAPRASRAGTTVTVDFTYSTHPRAGLYFVKPGGAHPSMTPEIWTQGEPTDNRRWFPTWDEPNAKTPSELIVTVPRRWTVIANGFLKSRTANGAQETWDWRSSHPKSTYLIAFAAGPFSRYHSRLGKLDVDSYVPPSDAALNAICFGETRRMIAYYDRVIGVAYPFSKYDQVAAERVFFGGMENESVTIIAAKALHPAIEDTERSCDLVVSHELAQHWFGDDATMMDWSNVWLNEGFATYFDELWTGEKNGSDAFDYARYEAQQAYFAQAREGPRPVVDYRYTDPLELFDAIGHEGAAERIHMLRYLFGDRRFFAALRTYLTEYQYRNATTGQFFSSIGRTLGTDLHWFEDEWFFRPSYPIYDVRFSYDSAHRQLTLDITQSSAGGTAFRMPVEIEAYASGRVIRTRAIIDSKFQRVVVRAVPSTPDMILFDPGNQIVRQLHVVEPATMLAYQVLHAPSVADRLWAIDQLGQQTIAIDAIRRAAISDRFYGVRAAAIATAARLGDARSVDAGLADRDVRVRLAALEAVTMLGNAPQSTAAIVYALHTDPNPDIAAAALTAIGRLHLPNAYPLLVRALDVQSFDQTIASGAIQGLAELGDARAFPLILERTGYGINENERNHAIAALAQLAVQLHREHEAMTALLTIATADPIVSTRLAAIKGLGVLGERQALPALERLANADPLSAVRLSSAAAVSSLKR